MTGGEKSYLQNVSRKCNFQQSEKLDFQNSPDPPRRTKISVRRFAAIRNFCSLLGTHSKFGLDPRLFFVILEPRIWEKSMLTFLGKL